MQLHLQKEVGNMVLGWIVKKSIFQSFLTINNDVPGLTDENDSIAQKWFEDELTVIGLHSFNPALIGNIQRATKKSINLLRIYLRYLGLGINRS